MSDLVGKEAIFHFAHGGDAVKGKIKYVPASPGDNFILTTDFETFYIQNYVFFVIANSNEQTNDRR